MLVSMRRLTSRAGAGPTWSRRHLSLTAASRVSRSRWRRVCLLMHPCLLRNVLTDVLAERHACYESSPGLDALGEELRPTPDLIVLDLGTPSATEERLEVVRAVRQEAELRAVPVLAITTDIGAARRRRSELKDLGVRVLGLPFDLATLDDRIASLV